MLFVDGENLAIRYKEELGEDEPLDHIHYQPDVYLWSGLLELICAHAPVVRKHYYTSLQGDSNRIDSVVDKLKEVGIEVPRVFKKPKGRKSKRVDITLATEMLEHATRGNYDVAVLIAGDEDYVPLVEAVKGHGCRVHLWFFQSGLSPALRRSCDVFKDLREVIFESDHNRIA